MGDGGGAGSQEAGAGSLLQEAEEASGSRSGATLRALGGEEGVSQQWKQGRKERSPCCSML